MNLTNGIDLTTLTGESRRGQISSYHSKPSILLKNAAERSDINSLPQSARERLFCTNDRLGLQSKYTIGFEIEKTTLHRSAVREYPLFCGFESDSSCGYEAVTNVLPLLPASAWRSKVYSLFSEARHIIEDSHSPSSSRCGGHVHLGVDGMTGAELMERIRPYVGIILAIYRKRLSNQYCSRNPQLVNNWSEQSVNGDCYRANRRRTWRTSDFEGIDEKYSVCRLKSNDASTIEFRLPTRVRSVKAMMRRYELFYELVDAAVTGKSYASFVAAIKPILMRMYGRDADKVTFLLDLAKRFNKFVQNGQVTEHIVYYLQGHHQLTDDYTGDMSRFYSRSLRRMIRETGLYATEARVSNEWSA